MTVQYYYNRNTIKIQHDVTYTLTTAPICADFHNTGTNKHTDTCLHTDYLQYLDHTIPTSVSRPSVVLCQSQQCTLDMYI